MLGGADGATYMASHSDFPGASGCVEAEMIGHDWRLWKRQGAAPTHPFRDPAVRADTDEPLSHSGWCMP